MGINVGTVLAEAARRHPDRIAVSDDAGDLTFAELEILASRFSGMLTNLGVERGDRVLLGLGNTRDFPVAYYGALRAGAIVVPVNPLMPPRDVDHYVRDSEANLAIINEEFVERFHAGTRAAGREDLRAIVSRGLVGGDAPANTADDLETLLHAAPPAQAVQTGGDDLAVIIYTSGTTGRPKGASLTHLNLVSNAHQLTLHFGWLRAAANEPDRQESVLGVPPLFHSIGQTVIMNTLFAVGGRLRLIDRFNVADASVVLEQEQITALIGVPTMFATLAAEQATAHRNLDWLRLGVSGGSPLSPETRTAVEAELGLELIQVYGLSETSPIATAWTQGVDAPPTSVGRAMWGVEVAVRDSKNADLPTGDIGEICMRGHNIMAGYWRREDATAEAIDTNGWFHSGDLGRVDENGFLYIVDRKKNMIIRNGFNVYPREVEDCLLEHPDVLHAAVIAVPDDRVGEEVGAFVVAKPSHTIDLEELTAWVAGNVAPQKRPRLIAIISAMPMTSTGKILKSELPVDDLKRPCR